MDPYWGSILVALVLAGVLALRGRPTLACMVMGSVLTFWSGGRFAVVGIYMQIYGKEAAMRDLNMTKLVIEILFIVFFFVSALVIEGRRSKRLKKAEDRLYAIDHPKQGEPRPR